MLVSRVAQTQRRPFRPSSRALKHGIRLEAIGGKLLEKLKQIKQRIQLLAWTTWCLEKS